MQLVRGYATKDAQLLFWPSPLGEALVGAYRKMGLTSLWQPALRCSLTATCRGSPDAGYAMHEDARTAPLLAIPPGGGTGEIAPQMKRKRTMGLTFLWQPALKCSTMPSMLSLNNQKRG